MLALAIAMLLSAGQAGSAGPEIVGLPDAVRGDLKSPELLAGGRYRLVARWDVATGSQHLAGARAKDPAAQAPFVWEVRAGAPGRGKVAMYGPYRDVPAGVYVALLRVKLLDDGGEERVGDLDAVVNFGQTVCATRHLVGDDLEVGRYVWAPLAFACAGGKLEIRLHWHGYAGLRLDRVELYRVEGASALPQPKRAREAVPSGEPRGLRLEPPQPTRRDPFPRSAPPAKTLFVCDLTREAPDVQLCALVLQGLINRAKPTVYCLYNGSDASWLNWMRRNKWVTAVKPVASWRDLLARYASLVKGVVITDPRLPATKNVATMVASVENGLVVSPRMAPHVKLPVLADLRGRWTRGADAYQWALDNLWPRLNHELAACSFPEHLGLRDYLVQHRGFIFWISGALDGARPHADPTAEARVAERLLARMPANTPIMSYPWAAKDVGIGEGPGVTLFAEFGKYLVGSVDCTNLSVHSGIRLGPIAPRPAPETRRLESGKVYVSFIMSDGDNLPVLTVSNFPQLWADPRRGRTPIGWTVSPAAWLLMPDVVSFYYRTATPNDAFLAAVSGMGYTYPDSYGARYDDADRPAVFDGFLDQTARYMRESGLRSVWIMNATRLDTIQRYAERIPGLEAIFPDYGRRVAEYQDATYPVAGNVGVFHGVTGWAENDTRAQKVARMVEELRRITPAEKPAFLHAFIWNWGADLGVLEDVMRELGPGYVAVRPDHLARLYREELGRRKLLVRSPQSLAAIEGARLTFGFSMHNVGTRAEDVTLEASSGLSESVVEPAQSSLAPGRNAGVTVTGLPSADRIGVTATVTSGKRMASIPVRRILRSDWIGSAPQATVVRFMRLDEAETLAHAGGRSMPDTSATGARAWLVDAATAKPGYAVFGPYASMEKGSYVAAFRVRRLGDGGTVTFDTSAGAGTRVTGSRTVSLADIPSGAYGYVAVAFDHPGGDVETRVLWPGGGAVALDWAAVWRVVE